MSLFLLCLLFSGSVLAAIEKGPPSSVGPCILNRCPEGFNCADSACYPDMTKMEKVGECVNTLCPDTYFCHDDSCLRLIPKILEGSSPIGPCVNQKCPAKHVCQESDYKCYPQA